MNKKFVLLISTQHRSFLLFILKFKIRHLDLIYYVTRDVCALLKFK